MDNEIKQRGASRKPVALKPVGRDAERAEALRANLMRRKAQARARIGSPVDLARPDPTDRSGDA